jgi:hypothetical protein
MIGELVRPSLVEFIRKRTPHWDPNGFICHDDLGAFRKEYVTGELGELSALDQEVIESLQQREILSADFSKEFCADLVTT